MRGVLLQTINHIEEEATLIEMHVIQKLRSMPGICAFACLRALLFLLEMRHVRLGICSAHLQAQNNRLHGLNMALLLFVCLLHARYNGQLPWLHWRRCGGAGTGDHDVVYVCAKK